MFGTTCSDVLATSAVDRFARQEYAPEVWRRLVYIATGACVAVLALFAVVLPEVRPGFVILTAAIVVASSWLTRRLPAAPVSIGELLGAAMVVLVLGMTTAAAFPSTLGPCPVGPAPRGVPGGSCPVDHHGVLRAVIAAAAVASSTALVRMARRRRSSTPRPAGGIRATEIGS